MNRVIAALHSGLCRPGLADYGKSGNYFERQIGRWSKQYVASITQPIPEMDKLMAWLPANMPASAADESRSPSCTATIAWTT
jgi:aminoglycoside phosphotransferase (APT) family kinase protein